MTVLALQTQKPRLKIKTSLKFSIILLYNSITGYSNVYTYLRTTYYKLSEVILAISYDRAECAVTMT